MSERRIYCRAPSPSALRGLDWIQGQASVLYQDIVSEEGGGDSHGLTHIDHRNIGAAFNWLDQIIRQKR